MKFKLKDTLLVGFIIGAIAPIFMYYATVYGLEQQGRYISTSIFEDLALFIICANAVIMNFVFFNNEKDNIGKGMFITTGIYALIYTFYFYVFN